MFHKIDKDDHFIAQIENNAVFSQSVPKKIQVLGRSLKGWVLERNYW